MKKLIALLSILFILLNMFSAEVFAAETTETHYYYLNPAAAVYTCYGDEGQTYEKWGNAYTLYSKYDYGTNPDKFFEEPARCLYYRYDLSWIKDAGYSSVGKVVLFQGDGTDSPGNMSMFLTDDDIENGYNYKEVPKITTDDVTDDTTIPIKISYAKKGNATVLEKCPKARSADNYFVNITSYVNAELKNGDYQFSFMLQRLTKGYNYLSNHPVLYIELSEPVNNLYTNINKSNMLNISGTSDATEINIDLKDSDGTTVYSISDDDVEKSDKYFTCSIDMDEFATDTYTLEASFDDNVKKKTIDYLSPADDYGKLYTSLNYQDNTMLVYGRIDSGTADLTVTYDSTGESVKTESKTTDDEYFSFKFSMNNMKVGNYTVSVSGNGSSLNESIKYDPDNYAVNDIDTYTTTYYAPWLLNYHLTNAKQVENGYKGGEGGQMVWALEICPDNSDIVLAGTDTSGVWKSEDGGKTWRSSSAGFNSFGVADFAFDPDNTNIVYALGSTGQKVSSSFDVDKLKHTGIYKSYDCGETWTRIYYNVYHRIKSADIIKFSDPDANGNRRIYVGSHAPDVNDTPEVDSSMNWDESYYGALYSDDDGNTWNHFAKGLLDDIVANELTLIDDYVIVSAIDQDGNEGGIYKLDRDGTAMVDISPYVDESKHSGSYTLAINPVNPGIWICGADQKIFKSTDSGESWTEITGTLFTDSALYKYNNKDTYPTSSTEIAHLKYAYDGSGLFCNLSAVNYNFIYSTDDGSTWTKFDKAVGSTGFSRENVGYMNEPFCIYPDDSNKILMLINNEFYISEDGGKTFAASSSGYSGMRATDFAFDPDDSLKMYLSLVDWGVVRTVNSNAGENYPIVNYDASEDSTGIKNSSKTMDSVTIDPKNKNRVLIGVNGIIKESFDGGKTYYHKYDDTASYKATIDGTSTSIAPSKVMFNPDNPNTIYAGKLVSYDDGNTWTHTNPNGFSGTFNASNVTLEIYDPIEIISYSDYDGNTVYGYTKGRIVVSYDEGRTWKVFCNTYYGGGVYAIISDASNEGGILASNTGQLWRIYSDGSMEVLTPDIGVAYNGQGLAQNPRNPNHIITAGLQSTELCVSSGIFETYDGGVSWHIVDGMPATRDVWKIEFHPTLPRAYIATSAGTYVYEYEKYNKDNVVITDLSNVDKSGITHLKFNVWNPTDETHNSNIYVAMYDESGRLTEAKVSPLKIFPTEANVFDLGFEKGLGERAKIFIWDNELSPLVEAFEKVWNLSE